MGNLVHRQALCYDTVDVWVREHKKEGHAMQLNELRNDCAMKQKKGLHFILASVLIWTGIACVHLSHLPVMTKNLLTFCCTAPLMPLSFVFSRLLHIDFQNKQNPLSKLGLLFSVNQLLYLLIAMWVYGAMPNKLVMVLAMIFGAHLMPFSWLYRSKSYFVFSILIPLLALVLGLLYPPHVLAIAMIFVEILFSLLLYLECKKL